MSLRGAFFATTLAPHCVWYSASVVGLGFDTFLAVARNYSTTSSPRNDEPSAWLHCQAEFFVSDL